MQYRALYIKLALSSKQLGIKKRLGRSIVWCKCLGVHRNLVCNGSYVEYIVALACVNNRWSTLHISDLNHLFPSSSSYDSRTQTKRIVSALAKTRGFTNQTRAIPMKKSMHQKSPLWHCAINDYLQHTQRYSSIRITPRNLSQHKLLQNAELCRKKQNITNIARSVWKTVKNVSPNWLGMLLKP